MRKDLEDKNFQITMLKQKHIVDIDKVKDNIAEAMDVKLQGQLAK